jgi:hypothetical protein
MLNKKLRERGLAGVQQLYRKDGYMSARYHKIRELEIYTDNFLYVFFCAFYTLMNNYVTPTNAQYLLNMMY